MHAQFLTRTVRSALSRMREDSAIFLCIALYACAAISFLNMNDAQQNAAFGKYLKEAAVLGFFLFPICAVTADLIGVIHRFDRRRGYALRKTFSPRRLGFLLSGSVMLFAIMLFGGAFTSVKNTLVIWQGGFHFDPLFADIDARLHFGADPWRLVTPLMESAAARIFIGYNYGIVWFLVGFGGVFFVASSPKAASVRSRYLVSFMLVWVLLGNVLAGMFMSAGPAFYAQVSGDSARFAGLAAFLRESAALGDATGLYQDYLWRMFESGQAGFASGISAFPSVHVGLVVMNTLFAWDANRKLGWVMIAYSLLIMASSVGLGWHYAIDGYASAITVIVIHAALKRIYAIRPSVQAPQTEMAPASAA